MKSRFICQYSIAFLFITSMFLGQAHADEFEERHGDWFGIFSIGLGVDYALPVENEFGTELDATMGLGFTTRVGLEITPDLFGGVELGLLFKEPSSEDGWAYFTSILPTVLYYPLEQLGLYGKLGVGMTMFKETQQSDSTIGFSTRIGLGYEIRVHDRITVGIEGNYDMGLINSNLSSRISATAMASMFF